jgi:hypothetical protein
MQKPRDKSVEPPRQPISGPMWRSPIPQATGTMTRLRAATILALSAVAGLAPVAAPADEGSGNDVTTIRAQRFDALDKNADGSLSMDEFMDRKSSQANPEQSTKAFGKMDKDSNGSLNKEEFVNVSKPGKTGDSADSGSQ